MPLSDVSNLFLSKFTSGLKSESHFGLAKSKYLLLKIIYMYKGGHFKFKIRYTNGRNQPNTYSPDLKECLIMSKSHFMWQ